jgi:hypothetical protein
LEAVAAVDKRMGQGGDRRSEDFKTSNDVLKEGSSSEETAKTIGVSQRMVERARFFCLSSLFSGASARQQQGPRGPNRWPRLLPILT